MNLYVILRRSGWPTAADLQEAAGRSMRIGNEEMPDEVRWIRSYVLDEGEGTVGTVCVYQGVSAEAVREHARRAGIPADEVIPVLDTVLVRPDPEPAAAGA
jgi:sporulation protein YlmC with PRC-barrel domain